MKFRIVLASLLLLCSSQQVLADCFSDLAFNPELQSIRGKVALADVNEQTFSMMANDSRPTADEKQAIYKWGLYRDQCRDPSLSREGFDKTQSLILELHNGAITYGQFTKLRRENANAMTARSQQQILQMLMLQQQQSPPQQYQPPQPSKDPLYNPYSKPPPITTKCRWDVLMKETVCETR